MQDYGLQILHSLPASERLRSKGRNSKEKAATSHRRTLTFRTYLVRASVCAALSAAITLSGCKEPTDAELLDEAVKAIAAGKSTRLDMRKHTKITDTEFAKLVDLSGLHWLRLDGCQVTDENVHYLASIPDLETLYVSNTRVSDDGLKQICGIQTLKKLTLDGTPITDSGLAALKELPNLEELSLWKCNVTDRGCGTLAELTGLKKLSLDGTQVTDSGLRKLYALKGLERISLWKAPVTDEGIAAIKKALPELDVNH